MDTLRTPFYLAALLLFLVAWGLESGSALGLSAAPPTGGALYTTMKRIAAEGPPPLTEEDEIEDRARELVELSQAHDAPPGLAVSYLGLLDLLVLVAIVFLGAGLLIRTRQWGRIQGGLNLVVSLLVLIASILLILMALTALLTMVGLFLAAPFGTLAYLAIYGFFPRGAAAATLSAAMGLKVASGVCLVLAQQRLLFSKALVAIFATSLVGSVVVSFLHGLVPIPLVSITDTVAAIVVGILAAVWAVILLILSLPAVVRAVT